MAIVARLQSRFFSFLPHRFFSSLNHESFDMSRSVLLMKLGNLVSDESSVKNFISAHLGPKEVNKIKIVRNGTDGYFYNALVEFKTEEDSIVSEEILSRIPARIHKFKKNRTEEELKLQPALNRQKLLWPRFNRYASRKWNEHYAPQPYDYFVVIDLEATCDDRLFPVVSSSNQEIIEFPWVVISSKTGEIVDQKQYFVKPTVVPKLTNYCSKLTGIKQSQVDAGDTLDIVVKKFEDYCRTNFQEQNKTFCVVTDGDWDLKCMLQAECLRKNIKLPQFLRQYVNIQEIVANIFLPDVKLPRNCFPRLAQMIYSFELSFKGHHHSGIDDCHTIGSIVQFVLKRAVVIDKVHIFDPSFDPIASKEFNLFSNTEVIPNNFNLENSIGIRFSSQLSCNELNVRNILAPRSIAKLHVSNEFGVAYVEFTTKDDVWSSLSAIQQSNLSAQEVLNASELGNL